VHPRELSILLSLPAERELTTSCCYARGNSCGDVMKLQIRVDDDGIISDVKFKTFGCGSAIASSSYMTERVKGLSLEEAGKIKNTEIAKELALPPVKLHCSSA
jgi:iron-sulfur cluster assembly enzyme ISCU, mitochondrial